MNWELTEPPAELAAGYRRDGLWTDDSFGPLLWRGLSARPDLDVRIWSRTRPARLDFAGVRDLAGRLAAGLRARGIAAGDVVAFQMPNCIESVIAFSGLSALGAVLVPIVHTYGRRELGFILARTGAKALITADRFGARDYLAELDEVRATIPELELVVVVGDRGVPAGAVRFDDLLAGPSIDEPQHRADPASPAVVAYTSGTGADPKGVVHTHRGLCCEVRSHMSPFFERDRADLMGSPVSHVTGMLAGVLMQVERGQAIHLVDTWDPGFVLASMLAGDLSSGSGATVFLTSLLDHPDFGPEHQRRMSVVGLGGAPIPLSVVDRAAALGITVKRAYGATEHPTISATTVTDPLLQRQVSEGRALPGVEIRTVDDDGRDVGPGEPGEIITRGPDRSGGYTDPALNHDLIDDDWWLSTGDVGILDEDGYLRVVDRKKDLIIRGGTNISPAEVEQVLGTLDAIAEVAVVGVPDERLGERGCAVVRLRRDAAAPGLDDVRRHLADAGLGKQKWPEEIVVVDDFPRTPSGKVKKFELRAQLRAGTLAPT